MGIDEDSSWEDNSFEDRMGSSWPDSNNAENRLYNSDGRGCISRMDNSCEGNNCVCRECVTECRHSHSDLMHEQLSQLTHLIQALGWELTGQQVTIAVVRKQLEEQQLKFERQMAGLESNQLGWYVHQPHCRCMLCTLQLEQRERARDAHGKIQHLPQPRGAAREQRSEQGVAQQLVRQQQGQLTAAPVAVPQHQRAQPEAQQGAQPEAQQGAQPDADLPPVLQDRLTGPASGLSV